MPGPVRTGSCGESSRVEAGALQAADSAPGTLGPRRGSASLRERMAALVGIGNLGHLVPIGLDHVFTLVLGLVGLRLVSRFVPPSVFGPFTLFSTLPRLSILATHAGILSFANRHWAGAEGRRGALAMVVIRAHLRNSGLLLVALVVLTVGFALNYGDLTWIVTLPAIVACCIGEAMNMNAYGVLQASQRYWAAAVASVSGVLLRTTLPIVSLLALGASLWSMILGYTVYVLAVLAISGWALRGEMREGLEAQAGTRWDAELASFSVPFLLVGGGTWLLFSVDRWIAVLVFGKETGGQFALAFSLGSVLPGIIAATLGPLALPQIYKRADAASGEEDWRQLFRVGEALTWAYVAGSCVALLGLAEVMRRVGGYLIAPHYEQALHLLLPAGCAYMGSQIFVFQHFALVGRGRRWAVAEIIGWLVGTKIMGGLAGAVISLRMFIVWQLMSVLVCTVVNGRLARRRLLTVSEPGRTGSPMAS